MQKLAITLLLGALFYKYPLISLILIFVFIFYFRKKKEVKLVIIIYLTIIFFIIISQICFFNEVKQVMLVVDAKENYILVSNLIKKYYLPIKNNKYGHENSRQISSTGYGFIMIQDPLSMYSFQRYHLLSIRGSSARS